ncbi:MAG: LPXTG cell wall anchor domain-containing protein [Ruminococcus sp.]|nr:LPXTG cell wall anchor domain-containing protein [Ruminococcus sp.]
MRLKYTDMIRKYLKVNKNRSILKVLVRVMACLVVFCTTYALILPVITMEQEYTCGYEEHIHTESCYAHDGSMEGDSKKLVCGCEEHIHDASCSPKKIRSKEAVQSVGAGETATLTLDFTSWGPWNPIEFPQGNTYTCEVGSIVTITLDDYQNRGASYSKPDITVSGCTVLYVSCTCDQGHTTHSGWSNCGIQHKIALCVTDTNARIECSVSGYDWPKDGNSVVISSSGSDEPATQPQTVAPSTQPPTAAPQTQPPTEPQVVRPGYPTAVKTGKSAVDTLYFYNFATTGSGILPLSGCEFLITGTTDDGKPYSATIYSDDTLEIQLPHDIPTGSYTITEVSTPDGYMRDSNHTRTFGITYNHTVGEKTFTDNRTIGSFLNHSLEDLDAGKYAEVEDYNNRTYEIVLQAESSIRLYEMDPIDVLFVVDQSNSMLFPSGLRETGTSITLYQDPSESWWSGNQNLRQMDRLDKNQLYYIIADPSGTSTVFAVWHNGERWMYQDASYYAKAWHDNADGYRQEDEIAIFPLSNVSFSDQPTTNSQGQTVRANGGDLGMTISGTLGNDITSGGSKTYKVYTAVDQYNRLHYLEESLSRAIYQLSDANVENTATLIRFTKTVDETHCMGPMELTPDNADILVDAVNSINTTGGTRQDLALEHAYNHLTGNITYKDGSSNDKYIKDKNHTFTILITDGAPVRSGNSAPPIDTIYSQIRSYGAQVRQESTLVTIGLGMNNVEGGKQVLQDIATLPQYANMLEDASDLTEVLHDLLFSSLTPKETQDISGDVEDVISDSFYPIAWVNKGSYTGRTVLYSDSTRDWVILEPDDWITLDGEFVGRWQGTKGHGQLTKNSNGDMTISWSNRRLSDNVRWTGRFYVKAKEDFIGGNAIDTNKYAAIDVGGTAFELPVPTVNVRLLSLNQNNSEVTVYLGDIINATDNGPIDSLKYFYNNTQFTKIHGDIPDRNGLDFGVIQNAVDPNANIQDGLQSDTFLLKYAMGQDLTEKQWQHLMESQDNTVVVDYTYDDDSSHGPVGYFTFRLTKNGETSDYNTHHATLAGERVEDYTLHVTYTAYELSQTSVLDSSAKRPSANVHNGTAGPGTQVSDEVSSKHLEDGYGIVDKDNVHIVNVISGSIRVTKEITNDLVSDVDQTFYFTLHRGEDGNDHSQDITLEVTVKAGQTTGVAQVDNLKRGTYTLTEQPSEIYTVKDILIEDATNCYSVKQVPTATFHMGYDTLNRNVIGKTGTSRYTDYVGTPNGVFGGAKVTNEKTVYYGEIPVIKRFSGADAEGYDKTVFVVLYKNTQAGEQLVLDENSNARLLILDAENDFKGTFKVPLPEKGASVEQLGYFVREVTGIGSTSGDRQTAVLENDGTTILYYQSAVKEEEIITLSNRKYFVTYEIDESTGACTVTNHAAVALPSTGGAGTNMYLFSGLALVAITLLILGYIHFYRRKKGGRL